MSDDYRELEKLVVRIQKQLAPQAEVLHNQMLPGRKSGRDRQIDVLLRQRVAQYEILIIIDCKDTKRKVDVKAVEEFIGLFDDVGAHKGVLVCPTGFTTAAKTRATEQGIELYSPVDTGEHKWRVRASVPALCDFRGASMSFQVQCSAPVPFMMKPGFFEQMAYTADTEQPIGSPFETAIRNWNDGVFPDAPGVHRDVPIFPTMTVKTDNGYGSLQPVDLSVSLWVEQELFYGQFPITRITGFKDHIRGGVIANAFEAQILSPEEIEQDWTRVQSEDEAPVRPVLSMTGRVAWIEEFAPSPF